MMYLGPHRWHVYQGDTLVMDHWFTYIEALDWVKAYNDATEDLDTELYRVKRDR